MPWNLLRSSVLIGEHSIRDIKRGLIESSVSQEGCRKKLEVDAAFPLVVDEISWQNVLIRPDLA